MEQPNTTLSTVDIARHKFNRLNGQERQQIAWVFNDRSESALFELIEKYGANCVYGFIELLDEDLLETFGIVDGVSNADWVDQVVANNSSRSVK
jgi:hypothetical protein